MVGKKVLHKKYGIGEVVNERYYGYEYLVLFFNGMKKWIRFDEIEVIEENKESNIQKSLGDNFKDSKERNIIEALRFGIAPPAYLEELTVGREKEINSIKNWLFDSDNKRFLVIYGSYGSGKTHLVNYLNNIALKEGFATSRIELDYNEAPFYKPKLIYKNIVSSLRCFYENRYLGFRDIIKIAIESGHLRDNDFFKFLNDKINDENLWEWIEGKGSYKPYLYYSIYPSIYPSMLNYFTSLNVYCYLISTISWVICNVLKLKGLLLIFDEGENIYLGRREQIYKNLDFIKALKLLSINEDKLTSLEGISKLKLPMPKNSSQIQNIPYIYKLPFNLKVVFTLTDSEIKLDTNTYDIFLQNLTHEDLKGIFNRIIELYKKSYDLEGDHWPKEVLEYLLHNSEYLRKFIKGTVEALDLIRFGNKSFRDKLWK